MGWQASPNNRERSAVAPYYAARNTAQVRPLSIPAQLVVIAAVIAGVVYFTWRLSIFNPHAMLLSVLLYAAELFGAVRCCCMLS
jgi:hypothetical protein